MRVLSNILPINEREQLYKTIETNDKNFVSQYNLSGNILNSKQILCVLTNVQSC